MMRRQSSEKGDVCEGIIERYDFPNKGSFQVDERKVTIKGALPGQKVKYMVTKKKSGMAEGKVLEVLERSPLEDVEPTCPYLVRVVDAPTRRCRMTIS